MNTDDIDSVVRKLKEELAISEFHFRDAVIELIEQCRQEGGIHEDNL